jgi:hypothetical protein
MKSTRRRTALGLLAAVPVLLGLAGCNTRFGASLDRPTDPVVMTGASLPKLLGASPQHIVGFSWDGTTWTQVPVQVDERDYVNPGVIYHLPTSSYPNLYGTTTPYKMLVYTPPPSVTAGYTSLDTYTPSDSDPTFDSNDELSFLAADTGKQADGSAGTPAGVDASTREEVQATDPLAAGHTGYVYLFTSSSLTGGSAGTTGVTYAFNLTSGAYKTTYKMGTGSLAPNNVWGFNPETSTVTTPDYTQVLGDRWLESSLAITAPGASGVNILDRSKYYVTAGCVRTEDTFDGSVGGEGAFVVSISGPVRAIRSYIGANSYNWTVNTDIFYPDREDTVTELRGHAGLPGFAGADDLATDLPGMTYSDAANSGLPIDGVPDSFVATSATTPSTPSSSWQMVSGPQGSLITIRTLDTDITGLIESTLYLDQRSPSTAPCTGDGSYWGQNGTSTISQVSNVPITDPTLTATPNTFVAHRFRFFTGPGATAAGAAALQAQAKSPIQTSVTG